ncbi:SH3 domain-binding protein 5-like [Diadema antillarum]|uniref:SH3 domain-binding protein 5-like n=1 Tax=Diadema antillarum TaxID=105358 RepID=UPI003A8728E1
MSDVECDPTSDCTFLDPRIQEELERLNTASAEINRLEKQLDESRQQFRLTLTKSSQTLNEKLKKCRKSAAKAQSYYEAKEIANKAQESAQEAALRYKRAVGMFSAAKETIAIAEEAAITSTDGTTERRRRFDSALQEMLNLSTMKLNAAERERIESQQEHEERSQRYIAAQQKVDQLSKKFKRSIAKSAEYYDLKKSFFYDLNDLKIRIEALQTALHDSKEKYRSALKSLERISEDIHHSRQVAVILAESRQSGVGADSTTDSEPEGEQFNLSINLADKFSDISSTDQDSAISDVSSVSSPTAARSPPVYALKNAGRSVSGTSLPSVNEIDGALPPRHSRVSVEGASSISDTDGADIARASPRGKLHSYGYDEDDDEDDDDDDADIFIDENSDDDDDDSDTDAQKLKTEVNRRLRTISIGDLKSFDVNAVDEDDCQQVVEIINDEKAAKEEKNDASDQAETSENVESSSNPETAASQDSSPVNNKADEKEVIWI